MEKAIKARRTKGRRIGRRTWTARRPLAALAWVSIRRAYDGHSLLMVGSKAQKARGQQGRAERWMVSFSSSHIDLHIV